ncbi:MAG: hypothetical protein N2247_13900 [Leptospiraceae bacterium]|jgi:hypothetical protein|nr:hypothetical protein [Leptospiraceae bacterium]
MAEENKPSEEEKENKTEKEKPTIEIDLAEDKPKKDFIKVRETKKEKE